MVCGRAEFKRIAMRADKTDETFSAMISPEAPGAICRKPSAIGALKFGVVQRLPPVRSTTPTDGFSEAEDEGNGGNSPQSPFTTDIGEA
jgi:hypothetical protein